MDPIRGPGSRSLVVGLSTVVLLASSSSAACESDVQCKGNRICDAATCRERRDGDGLPEAAEPRSRGGGLIVAGAVTLSVGYALGLGVTIALDHAGGSGIEKVSA
jgi:hypothetical protein